MSASDEQNELALQTKGVTHQVLNTSDAKPRRLLDDVSISVRRGEFLHLIGPSGSGKTTFLRLVNRLDEPTTGEIKVFDRSTKDWPVRELRQTAGLVFQEPSLLDLSVRDNLVLPFRLAMRPPPSNSRLEEMLAFVELDREFLNRAPSSLSTGQKMRVTIARTLITNPQLLLLDEAAANLDRPLAQRLLMRLVALCRSGQMTVVMASHRLSLVRAIGGRVVVLIDGRIAAVDEVNRLLGSPPPGPVSRLLHGDQSDE